MRQRVNVNENGKIYGKWKIAPDTWCITDHWNNFIYLLIGKEKAMLIDTCSSEGNVREVVEELTDKEIMVVNTHGHFDHTGGNACWPEAWMTKEAAVYAKEPFPGIHREWFAKKPYPDYKIHFLKDGDVINLGEREVEVLGIPAHSEGSIALLDRNTESLFCGDEIESGQVILFVRNEAISLKELAIKHRENMLKLKARRKEYNHIWPAHNGLPWEPDDYLNDYIRLDEKIIEGTAEVLPDTAGFGFPADNQAVENPFRDYGKLYRVEEGVASFVYSEEESVYHND